MTLIQLRYFVMLSELRNFSRVAERFFVAQAAVSYQIRSLEQELGVRLFDRSTRSVQLTAAGRSLYYDIRPLLKKLDEACEKAKAHSARTPFVIAYSRVCFGERFNRMIELLSHDHPTLDVLLDRTEPEDDLLEKLLNGQVDAALFFNPYPSLPEGISSITLGIYDQCLIVSEQHRLAGRRVVTMDDIDPSEVFACEGMRRIEQIRTSVMSGSDNKGILLRDLDSVFAMVKAGRGVARLPVIDDVNITGLEYIHISDPLHECTGPVLTFAWQSGNDSPVIRNARQIAAELFPSPQATR